MGKGQSSRSGPPKDPNALRRERDKGQWLELPASGREGDPPEWPLTSPSGRELELWRESWATPQALAWEANHLTYEVALYVRNLAMAEVPGAPANRSTLVKQLMEDLGLTEGGLARNSWRIADDAGSEGGSRRSGSSSRGRLRVVADESA